MLQRVVYIISNSSHNIEDGTLFCSNHNIVDCDCIEYLEENNILENTISTKIQIGDTVNLELSLAALNSIGYYEDVTTFILKNKYIIPNGNYYIEEIKCYSSDCNEFLNRYSSVIELINSIKKIAKHNYLDVDTDISIIFSEDKALLLPFIYKAKDIQQISQNNIENVAKKFNQDDSKEKLIFINELIDFLSSENETNRFQFLLIHIAEFSDRADNAYQYYIRNFSYNKLKTDLDNTALEYSKKIQSVINDSQTKLIAIPTAFVLVTASMNFDQILSSKNIGIIISLFVFAWLLELFIRNQKSALAFIKQNIDIYKQTFKQMNDTVENAFKIVDIEWKKQNKRILIIKWIIWSVPIIILIISTVFLFIQKPIIIDTITEWYNRICQK